MNKKLFLSLLAAAACAACTKKAEEPAPKPADAASQVGVSTAGVIGQTLNAPGNYARTLAGSLDKAKSVSGMVNQKAAERENAAEAYGQGGN